MRPLILILAACLAAGPAFAQDTTRRVRGAIDAVNGRTLSVTDRGGNPLTITLKPNATIVAIVPASLSDITKGSFVGSAAMPGPDGRLLAIEVHIFPESMRGTGEGHRPFDLKPESTMTNGTVGDVTATSDTTLTVRYAGGEKQIAITPTTIIVTYAPGDPSLLAPGQYFTLVATVNPDGTLTTDRINVGKNGLVPPM
jgi:hypothetical protein